jgi:hypothetical protein
VIKNLDYGVLHDRLQELIELGATEHDCRALLLNQRILVHFARYIPRRIVNVWEENQGFFGRADLCFTVEVYDGERYTRQCYIYELKPPNCTIFVQDTKTRARPSPDLVSAENQLLHYVAEARGSDEFRRFFDVVPEKINFGGIIIGRTNASLEESTRASHQRALELRQQFFYKPNQIRLLNWSQILPMFGPPPPGV